ncbi:MAG: PASTA domain-containing protein [Paludibacteraceae bacterium]|nr:PASTA domain-containing protein [Paludibacteraceae bacterium]
MRAVFLYVLMSCFSLIIVYRIYRIQNVEKPRWTALSDSLRHENVVREIEPSRGNILADDGSILAASIPQYKLAMDFGAENLRMNGGKVFYDNVDSLALCLSKFFGDRSKAEYKRSLIRGYEQKRRFFVINNRIISHSEYKQVEKFPLFRMSRYKSGFTPQMEVKRIKPFGSLAAITIGNTQNERAQNGVERAFDKYLKGTPGRGHNEKVAGLVILRADVPAENGADVKTTLNVDMQDICEKALRRQMTALDADEGAVIMMEVSTGQIKSIVNLSRTSDSTYREKVSIALRYAPEPGSTFKVPVMMAALEDGTVKPTDSVDCGDGVWEVNSKITIRDFNTGENANHVIPVSQAIVRSSNVGMGKMIYSRYDNVKKAQHFVDMLHKIGVGKKFDFGFEGLGEPEILGPRDRKDWASTDVASMAYGYAVKMPLLYTLTFYNAIANDGKMVKPYLVSEITHNGSVVKSFGTEVIQEKICSDKTLEEIRKMILGVVEDEHGTAKPVQSEYVRIAGKTGTARYDYGEDRIGYKHQVSFCGYFPYENPKYSCIVYMRNPKVGAASGGRMAGTVFKEIAERVMASIQFLPVESFGEVERVKFDHVKQLAASRGNDTTGLVYKRTFFPQVPSVRQADAYAILSALGVSVDYDERDAGRYVSVNYDRQSNSAAFRPVAGQKKKVPNLVGMGLKDAVYVAERTGMKIKVSYSNQDAPKEAPAGKVFKQSQDAGSDFSRGDVLTVYIK